MTAADVRSRLRAIGVMVVALLVAEPALASIPRSITAVEPLDVAHVSYLDHAIDELALPFSDDDSGAFRPRVVSPSAASPPRPDNSHLGVGLFRAALYQERAVRKLLIARGMQAPDAENSVGNTTLHLYYYALGNPLKYVDPDGHSAELAPEGYGDPETDEERKDRQERYAGLGYGAIRTPDRLVTGLIGLALHPVQAARAVAGAARHPVATAERALERFASATPFEQSEIVAGAVTPLPPLVQSARAVKWLARADKVLPDEVVDDLSRAANVIESGEAVVMKEGTKAPTTARPTVSDPAPAPSGTMTEQLSSATEDAVAAPPQRPTWQRSESDIRQDLEGFGFEEQKSYRGGAEVEYGSSGSVRPDFASRAVNLTVDVKNYKLSTPRARYNLVKDTVEQAELRAKNLPEGMRQAVAIDLRGQTISDKLLNNMIKRIVAKSKGAITEDNIHVQR